MSRFLPVVLAFACIMFGFALDVNADAHFRAATSASPVTIERNSPTPIDLAKPRLQAVQLIDAANVSSLQDVPIGLTIEQVAAQPSSAFKPFSTAEIYPLNPQTALWLHFRVIGQAPDSQTAWTFALPKSFLDRVEFYHRNSSGGWLMEVAGDNVPQQLWPTRGLYPQFQLPAPAPGVHDFYVKVHHLVPTRLDPILKSTAQVAFENQNRLLAHGLILGVLLFMVLKTMVLSAVYRRGTYACYALYFFLAFLSVSAYVGVGHYAFWPEASWWSEQAGVVCLMAGLTAHLQFCRAMFVNASAATWMKATALVAIAVSAVATAGYVTLPIIHIEQRNWLLLTSFSVTVLGILLMTTRAALQRSLVARLFLLANIPAVCVLSLTLTEQYGLASLQWLPYDAILYALGYKGAVLLVALHLHVKSGHAITVRKDTLADVDPLTGFVAPRQFPKILAEAWSDARQQRRDLSVVYVQANFKAGPLRSPASNKVEAAALRCVRILRTVTRETDIVARVHANLFAILMPAISPGENLTAKLSRLIALGVMTDRDDPLSEPIQLRVAASSRSRFSGTAQQLDVLMRQRLSSQAEPDARSIIYVTG